MNTIKIPIEVKKQLNERFDMSSNQALKMMLESTDLGETDYVGGNINIKVDEEVMQSLKRLRLYESETYASIILRLMDSYAKGD